VLALASDATGDGALQSLQGFMTTPAGAAVVNATGPIRQLVRGEDKSPKWHFLEGTGASFFSFSRLQSCQARKIEAAAAWHDAHTEAGELVVVPNRGPVPARKALDRPLCQFDAAGTGFR
jgi:hypothetical protein